MTMRCRGGCLTLVPKSPVHSGSNLVGGSTFVSRPSRSTSHPAPRVVLAWFRFEWTNFCVGADRRARPRVTISFMTMRSRGGCLTLVPKSPVHSGTNLVGGSTFVSRPSRSTSHPAPRVTLAWFRFEWTNFCVGEDRCALPWVTISFVTMRSRGGGVATRRF